MAANKAAEHERDLRIQRLVTSIGEFQRELRQLQGGK